MRSRFAIRALAPLSPWTSRGTLKAAGSSILQMHVVAEYADRQHPCSLTLAFGGEEFLKERRYRGIDEGQAGKGGPGQMGIDANGHGRPPRASICPVPIRKRCRKHARGIEKTDGDPPGPCPKRPG